MLLIANKYLLVNSFFQVVVRTWVQWGFGSYFGMLFDSLTVGWLVHMKKNIRKFWF